MADAMPGDAQVSIWTASLLTEYDALERDAVAFSALIEAEHDDFTAWVDSLDAYLDATLPDSVDGTDRAEYKNAILVHALRSHTQALCGLRHGSPVAAGEEPRALSFDVDACALRISAGDGMSECAYALCGEHRLAARVTLSVGGKQAIGMWRLSLENLVSAERDRAGADGEAIDGESAAFTAWMSSYAALVNLLCPGDADAQTDLVCRPYEDMVAVRCAIGHAQS